MNNIRDYCLNASAPLCVGDTILVVIIYISAIFRDRTSFKGVCCSILRLLGLALLTRRILCIVSLAFGDFANRFRSAVVSSSFTSDFQLRMFFQNCFIVFQFIYSPCY